jgi:hypothetical protein
MARKIIFRISTPLGYDVVLTRNRWREIIRFKHPALAKFQKEVKQCLENPYLIRASTKDPDTHLFYLELEGRYLCVVVAEGDTDEDRFVITAYFTKYPKHGDELWTK